MVCERLSAWTIAFLVAAGAAQAATEPSYHVSKSVALGAPDRWDYVVFDAGANRVYASHGPDVTVVDAGSGAILGTIHAGGVTHGIGVAAALGKGYTDDSEAGTVAVFDLKSFQVLRKIKVRPDADGIVYDPQSGHVLVIGGDSGTVTVIDPRSDTVLSTIDGGGALEFGVPGGNGEFYVDGADRNEIVRMNLAAGKADAHWPLPGCKTPHGLALDRLHMHLFASCGGKTMDVMDADTGRALATLPIGQGTDFAEFDPVRGLAFSSNQDGTLSVIAERSPGKFAALKPIPTQLGARTMALDPTNGRIYLVTASMSENKGKTGRARYTVTPGTVRLLFLDPGP
ncbi:MAG: YncE family protein [Alphaproteobacteria bacterium]|nr:YncE family protein [Alphaproteobacteria bacterium]